MNTNMNMSMKDGAEALRRLQEMELGQTGTGHGGNSMDPMAGMFQQFMDNSHTSTPPPEYSGTLLSSSRTRKRYIDEYEQKRHADTQQLAVRRTSEPFWNMAWLRRWLLFLP